jgi:hypothetical protein
MDHIMEEPSQQEDEICRFMADEYASKVMSATYGRPLSIQQISEICKIPIAVAYRRVRKMASIGLIACIKEVEVYRGKKERYYICAVDELRYTFDRGTFTCQKRPTPFLNNLESDGASLFGK